ncbi:ABC transporter substrate-binding protein [Sphingomonas sp. BT-65]|uniref:ABC transporter substrate-binding protein n=1 Tax=Sphingomonas sp. BT-65 TaxID=2989821 RepID=UPI0022362443|nr:ABC transporter substrate-binding protein [Sphingomonas sp. BT-65]MCW4461045.1 ABC transporter substrate-binding protein [Sphingomonas sp. BT-65]
MRHLLHLAAIALLGVGTSASSTQPQPSGAPVRPQRIVSLNLCTDQLLMALADRDQIAGLTSHARDAGMSAAATKAQGLPILKASSEQLFAAKPDLILGMPASSHPMLQPLNPNAYRTIDLEYAESYAAIVGQIRTVAAAIGHPARGEALIRRMETELARIPAAGRGKVAAYYQRRGYLTGTGTLIDDLMTRTGLINLAAKLGKPPLSQVSLEEMVAAQPDFLIVESATARVVDQGTEMLHHPALRRIPRIAIPQAWTVCGGPAYVLAARSIAEQAARNR